MMSLKGYLIKYDMERERNTTKMDFISVACYQTPCFHVMNELIKLWEDLCQPMFSAKKKISDALRFDIKI